MKLPPLDKYFETHPASEERINKALTILCKDGQRVSVNGDIATLLFPVLAAKRHMFPDDDTYDLSLYDQHTVEAVVRIALKREVTSQDAASPSVIELLYFLGITVVDDWDQSLLWGLILDQLTVDNCAQFLVLASLHNGGKEVVEAARNLFASAIGSQYQPASANESSITFDVARSREG